MKVTLLNAQFESGVVVAIIVGSGFRFYGLGFRVEAEVIHQVSNLSLSQRPVKTDRVARCWGQGRWRYWRVDGGLRERGSEEAHERHKS